MIEFRMHAHRGVAPYLQIVQQGKQALRLDLVISMHGYTVRKLEYYDYYNKTGCARKKLGNKRLKPPPRYG